MASIDRYGDRWRARWRTPDGKSRSKVFRRKLDAERHLTGVEHGKLTGSYVDPAAGKITFKSYATEWLGRQVWRPTSAAVYSQSLARVYPTIADRPLAQLRTSELQALVRRLSDSGLAPATVETTYRAVVAVLKAAVTDRVIAVSPAVGVKVPRADRPKVNPLAAEQVAALADAVPGRVRAAVLFAAGSGLRMGEVLGLTVDRIDFLRRAVTVDRQLLTPPSGGEPTFGPPKTKASHRVVPLAQVTVDVLAAHLAEFPADRDGLVFTSPRGERWRRNTFTMAIAQARTAAGLPETVTFHDLRHHFASVLIAAGCSIKAVQSALGHANASETLDTYSHLWPADEDRIREAVQSLHGSSGARRDTSVTHQG
jgi:integrase